MGGLGPQLAVDALKRHELVARAEAVGPAELVGVSPGHVDQAIVGDLPGRGDEPPQGVGADGLGAPEDFRPARGGDVLCQGGEDGLGVDHGRFRGEKGLAVGDGPGLDGGQFLFVDQAHRGSVGLRLVAQGQEPRELGRVAGDDDLAACRQRQAPLPAIGPHAPVAGQAGFGPQAVGGVVDAGVEHAAVAARGVAARAGLLVADDDAVLAPGEEFAGQGQAEDAGADDTGMGVHGGHVRRSFPGVKARRRRKANRMAVQCRCASAAGPQYGQGRRVPGGGGWRSRASSRSLTAAPWRVGGSRQPQPVSAMRSPTAPRSKPTAYSPARQASVRV